MFWVVRVRARFDETTISPRRGNAPLQPNARTVAILDARGGSTLPSVEGQRAIESTEGPSPPLTRRFEAPGDAYVVTLVFDLPGSEREPRLLLTSGEWETRLLIGHENSFLHRKSLFRLS